MTPDGRRVWGYARASTKKQIDSPETQKQLINSYVAMNQLGYVDAFFVDSATSGKVPMIEREAGRDMVSRIRKGDVLIIAKLDRAFRRLADCVQILEQLERIDVSLHICNMAGCALDLSSPMGRFIIHIFAAFAEMERQFISQRTKEGLVGKARKGFKYACYPGYGFEWVKVQVDGKWEKVRRRHDGERAIMRKIAMWRLSTPCLSWNEIYDELRDEVTKEGKLWDKNRIMRACKAEFKLQMQEQRANR